MEEYERWKFMDMAIIKGKKFRILRKPRTKTYVIVEEAESYKNIHYRDNEVSALSLFSKLINEA